MNPQDSQAPDARRIGKHDNNGHPMSTWDHHFACRSCLRSIGQVCSRSSPCEVCSSWTDKMWTATENAERRSEVKRLARLRTRQAKAQPDTSSLMPPPVGHLLTHASTCKPREQDRSVGEDADWSPVEHPLPTVMPAESSRRAERPPHQPFPRGLHPKVGTIASTSTPKSARPAQAVKADSESTRPAQAVKGDSRVVWVSTQHTFTEPTTPAGWYGPVSGAGLASRTGILSDPPPVSRTVSRVGTVTFPGPARRAPDVIIHVPLSSAEAGKRPMSRARGRGRTSGSAYSMTPITIGPADPRPQAMPSRRVVLERPSPTRGEDPDPALLKHIEEMLDKRLGLLAPGRSEARRTSGSDQLYARNHDGPTDPSDGPISPI